MLYSERLKAYRRAVQRVVENERTNQITHDDAERQINNLRNVYKIYPEDVEGKVV